MCLTHMKTAVKMVRRALVLLGKRMFMGYPLSIFEHDIYSLSIMHIIFAYQGMLCVSIYVYTA